MIDLIKYYNFFINMVIQFASVFFNKKFINVLRSKRKLFVIRSNIHNIIINKRFSLVFPLFNYKKLLDIAVYKLNLADSFSA